MAVQQGFENLQSKDIVEIRTDGTLLVMGEDRKTHKMRLVVGAGGALMARTVVPPSIDQTGGREPVPVAQRWAGCDQVGG